MTLRCKPITEGERERERLILKEKGQTEITAKPVLAHNGQKAVEEDHQEDAEYDYEDIEHDDDVVACHVNKVCVCEQLD